MLLWGSVRGRLTRGEGSPAEFGSQQIVWDAPALKGVRVIDVVVVQAVLWQWIHVKTVAADEGQMA